MTSVGGVPVCLQSLGEEGEYGLWHFFEIKLTSEVLTQSPCAHNQKSSVFPTGG